MNQNIQQVIDWLNQGAPHSVFSMSRSLVYQDSDDLEDIHQFAPSEYEKLTQDSCGSVCCIAGAAAQFDGATPVDNSGWVYLQERALKFFGKPTATRFFMLPVFDPGLAPKPCTPQQAAEALKRWASQPDVEFNPWN